MGDFIKEPNNSGGYDQFPSTHRNGHRPNAYDPSIRKKRGTIGKIGKAAGRILDSIVGVIAGAVGGAVVGAGSFASVGMTTGLTGLATNPTIIQMGYEGRNFGVYQEEFLDYQDGGNNYGNNGNKNEYHKHEHNNYGKNDPFESDEV